MFVIFGFGKRQRPQGPGALRDCPRCHNTTRWNRMREFSQFTLFFIPIARWNRREFETCGICTAAIEV